MPARESDTDRLYAHLSPVFPLSALNGPARLRLSADGCSSLQNTVRLPGMCLLLPTIWRAPSFSFETGSTSSSPSQSE